MLRTEMEMETYYFDY